MNKLFLFLLFGLVIGLVSACKDDDDTDNNNNTPSMTAKVGSTSFTASSITAVATSNVVAITGTSGTSIIALGLPLGATGQQNITLTSAPTTAIYTEGSTVYTGYTGSINVSSWDTTNKTVKGTFSFSAQILTTGAEKVITEGTFTATYI